MIEESKRPSNGKHREYTDNQRRWLEFGFWVLLLGGLTVGAGLLWLAQAGVI